MGTQSLRRFSRTQALITNKAADGPAARQAAAANTDVADAGATIEVLPSDPWWFDFEVNAVEAAAHAQK